MVDAHLKECSVKFKDLSDLPASAANSGSPPDPNPRFAPVLAQAWLATNERTGLLAFAVPGTKFRHSWAGSCARKISYDQFGLEPSNPFTIATYHSFEMGHMVHDRWQAAMVTAFPNAEAEVKVEIPECESSGHVDLVLRDDDKVVAMELKSINGFGFKMAIGARGAPEGPRESAYLQGALNAYAVDADELVILLISLENLSAREVAKLADNPEEWQKFCAEWTFTRKEYLPDALAEIERVKAINATSASNTLAPRAIPALPKGARVTNPANGAWMLKENDVVVDTGTTWMCNYCAHQDRCVQDAGEGL